MTFDVEIGNTLRTVTVHRKGQALHVDVCGRAHIVDARRIGECQWSLLVGAGETTTPVVSVDVALAAGATPGAFDVHLAGRMIPVQIRPAGAFGRQRREGGSAAAAGPQRVVAPMPGKIVRVLVKAGDEVKARQGLVVVEAMKMENELRAARDGRVRDVAVAEGQSVEAGAVLVIVE
ncbi:MAG: hypothetical protein A3J29_14350 [Acidobacteria bacterium RIFCSPLOWO2_12_FULL_67_14b]|nr:MAG: hypothetical protein A3J29_14350 [Acidobacteria bacterium RIFCSPLOWO2_12_FULL_67_14b]